MLMAIANKLRAIGSAQVLWGQRRLGSALTEQTAIEANDAIAMPAYHVQIVRNL